MQISWIVRTYFLEKKKENKKNIDLSSAKLVFPYLL